MPVAHVRPDLLYAWKGPSLFVADTRGECGPDQPLSGYYFREARFLSALRLEIDHERLWRCEAATGDPESLAVNFVHPEEGMPGHGIPDRALDLRLAFRVGIAELNVVVGVANHARQRVECELAW